MPQQPKIDHYLAKAQKILKTDIRYLLKGGFWLSIIKVSSSAISFATSLAFANWLLPEVYGTYKYILYVLGLLSLTTLTGLDTATTQSSAAGNDGSVIPTLKYKMKWGLLGAIGSLGVAGYYFVQGNTALFTTFLLISIFIPFMDPFYLFTPVLSGKKDFRRVTLYNLAIKIFSAVAIITTIFFSSNLLLLIFVYLASNTFPRLFFLRKTLALLDPNGKKDAKLLSYGKHLSVMEGINQISTYLDKILIFHFTGNIAAAMYYFSFVPYKQIKNVFSSLNTLALPKFVNQSYSELRKTLPRKVAKLYLIIIPIIVAYIVAAPFLFRWIFPQYQDAVGLSQILILQLLFYPISLFSTVFTAKSEKQKLYVSTTLYSVIRIVLICVTVPFWGVTGAIASILGTNVLNSIIIVYLFYKKTHST